MRALWAASFVSGLVYNGVLFVSSCTSSIVSGVLHVVGVPSLVTHLVHPVLDTSARSLALGTSLVAGTLTGCLVYGVEKIRAKQADLVDSPLKDT
jgi:hypothetical protein